MLAVAVRRSWRRVVGGRAPRPARRPLARLVRVTSRRARPGTPPRFRDRVQADARRLRRRAGAPAGPAGRRRRPAAGRGAAVGRAAASGFRAAVLLLGLPRGRRRRRRRPTRRALLRACAVAGAAARERAGPRRPTWTPPTPGAAGRRPTARSTPRTARTAGRGDPEQYGAAGGDPARRPAALLGRRAAAPLRAAARPGARRRSTSSTCAAREVIAGQFLDVSVQARGAADVDAAMTVLRYKSAKYSIERPLHIGAALAGATPDDGRRAGRRSGCRSARPSSCATTCSASSATRPRPASRRATTWSRASAPCWSRWRSTRRPPTTRRCSTPRSGTPLDAAEVAELRGIIDASGAHAQVEQVIDELADARPGGARARRRSTSRARERAARPGGRGDRARAADGDPRRPTISRGLCSARARPGPSPRSSTANGAAPLGVHPGAEHAQRHARTPARRARANGPPAVPEQHGAVAVARLDVAAGSRPGRRSSCRSSRGSRAPRRPTSRNSFLVSTVPAVDVREVPARVLDGVPHVGRVEGPVPAVDARVLAPGQQRRQSAHRRDPFERLVVVLGPVVLARRPGHDPAGAAVAAEPGVSHGVLAVVAEPSVGQQTLAVREDAVVLVVGEGSAARRSASRVSGGLRAKLVHRHPGQPRVGVDPVGRVRPGDRDRGRRAPPWSDRPPPPGHRPGPQHGRPASTSAVSTRRIARGVHGTDPSRGG